MADTSKIGGIVLISRETIEDAGPWSPQSETARIVQDSFSADLDDGLLAAQVRLLTTRSFTVTPSLDYSPAYKADAIAQRISRRFAVAVPVPAKSIGKLTIT